MSMCHNSNSTKSDSKNSTAGTQINVNNIQGFGFRASRPEGLEVTAPWR